MRLLTPCPEARMSVSTSQPHVSQMSDMASLALTW